MLFVETVEEDGWFLGRPLKVYYCRKEVLHLSWFLVGYTDLLVL